jgi:hypothetical protein
VFLFFKERKMEGNGVIISDSDEDYKPFGSRSKKRKIDSDSEDEYEPPSVKRTKKIKAVATEPKASEKRKKGQAAPKERKLKTTTKKARAVKKESKNEVSYAFVFLWGMLK